MYKLIYINCYSFAFCISYTFVDFVKSDTLFFSYACNHNTTKVCKIKLQREVKTSELMMIDRTFVAEEQNILNKLREQEAKVNGN